MQNCPLLGAIESFFRDICLDVLRAQAYILGWRIFFVVNIATEVNGD